MFEVPALGVGDPRPLTGLGRFEHEAAAVDAATGIVYLTEDESEAGLYRFVPGADRRGPESLRQPGRLQMLAIDGRPRSRSRWPVGLEQDVVWVDVDDPEGGEGISVFDQGHARGGMQFDR